MKEKKKVNWRLKRLLEALEKPTSYDAAKQKAEARPTQPDEEFTRIE